MIDECFAKEIRKVANGNGSREAKFEFLDKARGAARELSCTDVKQRFNDVMKKYGRVAVGICVAVTILEHENWLSQKSVKWAEEVLSEWTNRPTNLYSVMIRDNLHFSRIQEPDYAGNFIRLTSM